MTRLCSTCKQHLPLDRFCKASHRADKLALHCKSCGYAKTKAYRDKNPGRARLWEQERNRQPARQLAHRVRKYNISVDEFKLLLTQQHNKCAICLNDLSFGKRGSQIDHCHTTNKVRGILCLDCNLGLGRFKDSSDLLQKAIQYVKR